MLEQPGDELQRFFGGDSCLFETRPALMPCQEKVLPSRAARGYMSWREERMSRRRWRPEDVRGERLSKSVME